MDFKAHWRGLLGAALVVWQSGRAILDALGRADFVIQHASNPGWLAVLLDALLDPPGFLTLPIIAIGLGLIWLDNGSKQEGIRNRKNSASGQDYRTCKSLSQVITDIQRDSGIEKILFPNRLNLNEDIVKGFIVELIRKLAISGEVTLIELRPGIWSYHNIDRNTVKECTFEKSPFYSIANDWDLVSSTGVRISHLYITKADAGVALTKLRQAEPVIGVLPGPIQ